MSSPNDALIAIEVCLGKDMVAYVENKHRGGNNGRKGIRYEDLFLAFKAAEAAAKQVDIPSEEWPFLEGQAKGFVDDAVLSDSISTAHFQLKNSSAVSWSSGKYSIEKDFEYQKQISDYLKKPFPTTSLVVSDEDIKTKLGQSIPASIKLHSAVEYFPFCNGSTNRLVIENTNVQDLLRKLAKNENAAIDELVGVFCALNSSCLQYPDGCSVEQVIKHAVDMYPGQIRSFPVDVDWTLQLDKKFVNVLANFPGLTYGATRGFFYWSAFGTSGILGFNCGHVRFRQLQDMVIQAQPTTFLELEALLS